MASFAPKYVHRHICAFHQWVVEIDLQTLPRDDAHGGVSVVLSDHKTGWGRGFTLFRVDILTFEIAVQPEKSYLFCLSI